VVLILDSRGIVVSGGVDVITRHEMYAKALANTSKLKLMVFTASQSINKANQRYKNLEIKIISNPTFNSLKFAKDSYKFIKSNNLDVKALVVGDPWASIVTALCLNKFLGGEITIQTQIHADIGDRRWRRLNLRNYFKYSLAKIFLPYSDSIRAVSKAQAKLIIRSFGVDKSRTEVIPVPINNLNLLSKSPSKRPRIIGFFGRIHQDRGIWEFIDLVKRLNAQKQDFNIIIAGDGRDKEKFLKHLYDIIPKSRVSYLGQIPERKLRKIWKKVGVLVSMAPVESYGRVMREALVAGVPVWACPSSGVKDLMDVCEKGTVKIINLNMNASDLAKEFEVLLKTKVSSKFAKTFIKDNEMYAEKLAQFWIKTINKAKKF
jgi:glycosyltransferase involved in cell wall biosynthesis